MGIGTKFSTNPSMVLGAIDPGVTPLEMAYAYTTISHGGQRVGGNLDATAGPNNTPYDLAPVAIDKITDPNGKTVAENKTKTDRILSPSVASTMKGILHLNVLEGTGKLAQFGDSAEWGKTGTTENNGDAWFCGGDEHFTTCVWVGHADTNTPMTTEYGGAPVDGGTFPALIWGRIMSAIENIYAQHKAAANNKGSSAQLELCSSRTRRPPPRAPPTPRRPPAAPGVAEAAGVETPAPPRPRRRGGGGGGGRRRHRWRPAAPACRLAAHGFAI